MYVVYPSVDDNVFIADDFPALYTVAVSELTLTVSNTTIGQVSGSIHEMITPWSNGMNWDYFPNNTGPVAGVDFVESPVATYEGYTAGNEIKIDVTQSMKKWNQNGNTGNEGFLIQSNTSNVLDDIHLCDPPPRPKLFVLANTFYTFTADSYHDPLGQFPYTPPFIAYTRLCVFIQGNVIIQVVAEDLIMLDTLLVDGRSVEINRVPPIDGTVVGFCLTVPPGLNTSRVDLTVASDDEVLSLLFTDISYTRLLPNEIGCAKFECDNQTVVVNGTMEGKIIDASTIVIQNDVVIMGNLTVDGSITLDANSSLLTTQGSLSATDNIKVLLDNRTYYDGEEVAVVIATNLQNTTVEFIGGQSPKSCQELQSKIVPISERFVFVVSLNSDPCQVNTESSIASNAIIISCAAVGVVVLAVIVAVIMYSVQRYKREKYAVPRVMVAHE